ncbi:MAG TPA: TonB-dependent receptor [Vicinamibacteria bacterium]|nr:TonB-dependent receptor [Vicinamibacteria bacterium]
MSVVRRCLLLVVAVFLPTLAEAQQGRIEGQVTREGGRGVSGVTVVINELSLSDITRSDGTFAFAGVPAGTYTVSFALGDRTDTVTGVVVEGGKTARADKTVDWTAGLAETLTVVSASRRVERVVEAPAAVTSVPEEEIEQKASHGQLPKLLEFTPGAEVTQSGIYDYNLNTRGFNSSLNRRVATLVDGRDPAVPFLGSQEWAAVSFPLDDLERLELVRGPSAALYGANASSGVLNLTTKAPHTSEGGVLRLTAGELDTVNADGRWAGGLGGGVWLKALAGIRKSGDFTVSRRGAAEYSVPCTATLRVDCLPQEAVPLGRVDNDDIWFGTLRLDKHLANGQVLTAEGGYADVRGPVFQTGIGRVQVLEAKRPWGRVNWSADRFNLLAYYTGRDAPRQLALSSGRNLSLDEDTYRVEGQTNWSFAEVKVRLVAGASTTWTSIDTADEATGLQTLVLEPIDSDQQAVFGQLDWKPVEKLRLVAAARGDWSSLHEAQFSPKASAVYSITPTHALRVTYNRAFQVPNYSEFFLFADAAPPVNLTALNAICGQFGVNCGFGPTRALAVGNAALDVEKISTWEAGYTGVLGNRAFVTAEYYRSTADDFITDLIPQLGTALGRVNPAYGPWRAPAGLPGPVADAIRAQVPVLSNAPDGSNIIAAASYTNFGTVDTQGIDLAVRLDAGRGVDLSVNYSWFDFEVKETARGLENLLLPNSPEHKLAAGIGYRRGGFDGSASMRWVDEFRWAVGPFVGNIESYTLLDLVANYALNENWKVGVNVANALDEEHWESFGGDLLGRRALGSVTFSW